MASKRLNSTVLMDEKKEGEKEEQKEKRDRDSMNC